MLKGLFTALITPFNEDLSVDYEAFEKIIDYQIQSGVSGIVVAGTTGEASTLTHSEHSEVMRFAVQFVRQSEQRSGSKMSVIAATGSNSTAEAIGLTREACDIGVDCVLLISPYYNKSSEEGLYLHFRAIAEESSVPCILYNVPTRTSIDIPNSVMARLRSDLPDKIVGVKDATGALARLSALRSEVDDGFAVLSGDDPTCLAFNASGGDGLISVTSNAAPSLMGELQNLSLSDSLDRTKALALQRRLMPLIRAMGRDINPIPIKYLMHRMGYCNLVYRLPLCVPSESVARAIDQAASELGLSGVF